MPRRSRTTRRCTGEFNFEPTLHVPARHYFDLAATYTLLDRVNLRAGVNNIFDKDPPLFTTGGSVSEGSNLCPTASVQQQHLPGRVGYARQAVLGRCDDRLHAASWHRRLRRRLRRRRRRLRRLRRRRPAPDGSVILATELPGTAAAAAAAGAGSGTRPLRNAKHCSDWGGGSNDPPPFSLARSNRFRRPAHLR